MYLGVVEGLIEIGVEGWIWSAPLLPSFKLPLRDPTERGTDEDEMQVDLGDLHSTIADYFRSKKVFTFVFSGIFTVPKTEK